MLVLSQRNIFSATEIPTTLSTNLMSQKTKVLERVLQLKVKYCKQYSNINQCSYKKTKLWCLTCYLKKTKGSHHFTSLPLTETFSLNSEQMNDTFK